MNTVDYLQNDGYRSYRQPILASIYNVLGVLTLAVAGVVAIVVFSGSADTEHFGPIAGVAIGIPILIAGAIVALTLFGTAQVIGYIGQTAHNTSAARDDEIVDLLKRIENHLAGVAHRNQSTGKE